MRIVIAENEREFAQRAADIVCEVVRQRPEAAIGLPSGRTPLGLYEQLARRVEAREADLSGVTAFAVDELHGLPADHPATNASYFRRHLTPRIPLRAFQVMDSASDSPQAECDRFRRLVEEAGGLDLVALGIGANGHIAFNEPGSPFDSRARRVVLDDTTREPYAEHFGSLDAAPAFGLTLGVADLLEARRVLLLVSGADKASVTAQALRGPVTEALPASCLQRHPAPTVLLDREAAADVRGW